MKNLFKPLKKYKAYMVILVAVLMVQAYCDLALPQYTQDIIDVGIQDRGIEHVLPEKITEKSLLSAEAFMTNKEKAAWEASYEKTSDGGEISSGDVIYVRKDFDRDKLVDLDNMLLTPIVLAYQSDMGDSGSSSKGEAGSAGSDIGETASVSNNDSDIEKARKQIEETRNKVGDGTLTAIGARYAAAMDEEAGVDVDDIQTAYLWKCGGKMFIMALIMFLAATVVAYFASRIGANIGRDLRSRVFARVVGYSSAEIDSFSTASLITRCTNDVQQIQLVMTMILRMLLYAPVMGIWGIIKVAQTEAGMEWIIVLAVLVVVGLVVLLMSLTLPKFKMMQTLVDNLNMVSREILTGLPVIRAFGNERMEEDRFDKANKDLTSNQLFTNKIMTMMMPLMMLIMNALVVLITWIAAHKIDDGALQVGAMTAFITYSMMIVLSFHMMSMMSILLPRAGVAADRIEEIMMTEPTILDPSEVKHFKEHDGKVELSHVDFMYPGAEEKALSDIDFTANAGETTAIIGSTGSGKSTLVNLIPRFYDVTSGSIKLNGLDVRSTSMKELRDAIGFVPQKGVLFSGTISSNIRFGNEDASDELVESAAEIAQAKEFIDEKEDKYDSFISQGGSNVSGGQKQRLAIARAIAKDPDVLVFDDSFSALDMKTDAKLRNELAEKLSGVTKIIVAQRISTILKADQIIVLDEGKIVGKGTHEELMESCSVYREIAESQLSKSELEGVK